MLFHPFAKYANGAPVFVGAGAGQETRTTAGLETGGTTALERGAPEFTPI